ncbi:MAG: hypothetical protein O9340_15235 [Cyclobacteriaceae bacterium]|jgi:hypothetical protein|nr:hypothetical protein [Cyclobacteriaceae bacterium]
MFRQINLTIQSSLLFFLLFVSSCSTEKKTSADNKVDTLKTETNTDNLNEENSEVTEEELIASELKERANSDSIAYEALHIYSGNYQLETESEGVTATVNLTYLGDKQFTFDWSFNVSEANCEAKLSGTLQMDRTQHGFITCNSTLIHVNFNGTWNGYDVIEILIEEPQACNTISGDCIFSGTYRKKSA